MFDQVKLEDLNLHVKIVAWLSIVSNAIFLILGGFFLFFFVGIGAASGEAEAFGVLAIIGTVVGTFFAVIGLPGIIGGIGLLGRAGWGRILTLVIAAFGLLNFPIGTVLGAYTFWVLLQSSADRYFSGPAFGRSQTAVEE
ncbi:MAG: hypothetical protein ACYC5O_18220 [Anaerolineae bacterium]